MLKKSIALISAVSMLLSFAACGENKEQETTTAKGKDVVATDVATDENGETVTGEDNKGKDSDGKSEDKTTDKSDGETTEKSDDKTTKKSDDKTTKKNDKDKTTKKETTTKKDSKPSTKAEVIDYYNKAVNKVKSDAKNVVLYYDNSTNYKSIVEAGGLSDVGKALMDAFLKENHERKEHVGTDAIVKAFPVENQKKSNITPDAVKNATCTDEGSYYKIVIEANCSDEKPDVNPSRGGGKVGKMFNILVPSDITDATEKAGKLLELEGIKYSYMGGKIEAHVDKATGNMTYLYTDLPMVLSMDKAKAGLTGLISVEDAKIGLRFENKWEINW